MKDLEKYIKSIHVDSANFRHIADSGNINGTLLVDIRRIMKEYAQQAVNTRLEEVIEYTDKRYAIALVFRKSEFSKESILLRTFVTEAISEEEALGKALNYFKEETKEYSLGIRTVTKVVNKKHLIESLKQ